MARLAVLGKKVFDRPATAHASAGNRAAVLGLRLHGAAPAPAIAEAPTERMTALELFECRDAADPARLCRVEAEISRRRTRDPRPGEPGHWAAFKDAYGLIRALQAAELTARQADHAYAYAFSDSERDCFPGGYGAFKAARLEACIEAQAKLAALADFAARFPLVDGLRAARSWPY
jgi:hypothetical protein